MNSNEVPKTTLVHDQGKKVSVFSHVLLICNVGKEEEYT